jgi:hypothetical protein
MLDVDRVARESAQSSEEIGATAHDLSRQAERLSQVVADFEGRRSSPEPVPTVATAAPARSRLADWNPRRSARPPAPVAGQPRPSLAPNKSQGNGKAKDDNYIPFS